ncbi:MULTISPECIES: glycosyltransferase [Morganella]|uniref:glycosyltransferase n=1 Tax=Morganella TaxID=581 RepID=UPI00277CC5F3|nr:MULTISPECIES: glycosyltransferase [unclassified Morganella (in: enterobacteria)]BEP19289.1 glycosyltransferase [Morganella morganii subsp. sibonii]HDS6844481.1 glycosyltransferase [Morganella morganii subsp. morganii]HDU8311232.1 glycosyltransferase [Morganella morganii subsp. sibonii]
MNILYLITGLGLGGAEKVVANLADQMYLKGHNVKIAYLKGKVFVSPKHSNIELVYLGLEKPTNILSAIKNYRALIKSYRPDVVHAHMVHANIFSRISRLFCNIPKLICTAHNTNEGGKLRMLAYKYTNCLSDLNTNVSQEASLSLINKGAFTHKNLKTVYNGIDLELFSKKEQSDNNLDYIQFLSVGRLNAQKDYFNLLNAIKIVSEQHENIHFNIVGDGDLYSLIEKSIIDLKISKFVSLLGARSDISQLMHKSDFFILSSSHEGLPTVLIEAQASQLFVIATDCGGSREIMGETGIIVPPKNSKALADGILKAIKMPSPTIKENNKKALEYTYKNFDLNKVANEWDNIYSQKKNL